MNRIDIETIVPISKNLHVLYVEDNQQAREQTVKLLENFFDHLTVAVDGLDGWRKYQEGDFDIIFTDINMPNMSGLEMLEKIRRCDIDVTCIIISAHDETRHFTKSIELGTDGYLLKPISLDPFLQLLEKSVRRIGLQKERQQYRSSLEAEIIERTNALEAKLYTDDLTGIGSRYAFLQELNRTGTDEIPLIYLLNIDGFTIYNELYGIEVGNEILVAFAEMIDRFAQQQQLRAFRVSGDEFVLYKTTDASSCMPDEQCVRELFNQIDRTPLYIETIDEYVTVSVTLGMACSRENPFGKADIALKAAKKSTRKYLAYHQELDNKVDLIKTL